jgi:signal transduction histidine kinase
MSTHPKVEAEAALESLRDAVRRRDVTGITRTAKSAADAGASPDEVREAMGLGGGMRSQPPPPRLASHDPIAWICHELRIPLVEEVADRAIPSNDTARGALGIGFRGGLYEALEAFGAELAPRELVRFLEDARAEGDLIRAFDGSDGGRLVLGAQAGPMGRLRAFAFSQLAPAPEVQRITSSHHEMSNALAAIAATAEQAALGRQAPEHALTMIRDIATATVQTALEARRAMRPRGDALSDATLVLEAVGRAVQAFARQRGVRLRLALEPGLTALLPAEDLRSIAWNLIKNAVEAAAEAAPEEGGEVEVEATSEGEHVRLRVSDDGPGMDPAALARAFEPFYSTKPTGLGVGLALVRERIEAAEGELSVRTAPGQGASFVVQLKSAYHADGPGRPSGVSAKGGELPDEGRRRSGA